MEYEPIARLAERGVSLSPTSMGLKRSERTLSAESLKVVDRGSNRKPRVVARVLTRPDYPESCTEVALDEWPQCYTKMSSEAEARTDRNSRGRFSSDEFPSKEETL